MPFARKVTIIFLIMQKLASFISKIIDFFYDKLVILFPKVSVAFGRQFFKYGVCGGSNMVLDWVLYFIFYNFIIGHSLVYFSLFGKNFCLTPHIATLCIVFPITLFTGFWLNKYVTFTGSTLRGWKQLFRYILIVAVNLLVNYLGLKLLVDICGFYPTPSKMIITLLTVAISYFGQKYFSFKL